MSSAKEVCCCVECELSDRVKALEASDVIHKKLYTELALRYEKVLKENEELNKDAKFIISKGIGECERCKEVVVGEYDGWAEDDNGDLKWCYGCNDEWNNEVGFERHLYDKDGNYIDRVSE